MDINDDDYLRRARIAAGLTQEDIAEAAGLKNKSVISLLENRHRSPRPEALRAIAYRLGLPLSELYLWATRSTDHPPE